MNYRCRSIQVATTTKSRSPVIGVASQLKFCRLPIRVRGALFPYLSSISLSSDTNEASSLPLSTSAMKTPRLSPRLLLSVLPVSSALSWQTTMGSGGENGVVPESVMEAVNRSLLNTEELRRNMMQFLVISEPDVLAEMQPLQRAKVLFLFARATSTLFTLWLRCSGVHPDDHPVKTELERLSLYQEKLERFINLSKAPLRPSATLNYQAATRFIEHSLPDLRPEQKQSLRDISRGEGFKSNSVESRTAHKKRKYQSSEKQSVRAAAQEFLEKAARELLGDNKSKIKGPLSIETSDKEGLGSE